MTDPFLVLSYLVGAAILIVALAYFLRTIGAGGKRDPKRPKGEIDTSPPHGLYRNGRLEQYLNRNEPARWTYRSETKTTTTRPAPKPRPKTRVKGASRRNDDNTQSK